MDSRVDAVLGDILTPEWVTPQQHADMRRPQAETPEKRLYRAILDDALMCYQHPPNCRGHAKRLREEAEAWLFGTEAGPPWKLTFEAVCEVLGLEPKLVRARLKAGLVTMTKYRHVTLGPRMKIRGRAA
jgi:hypothetical protein